MKKKIAVKNLGKEAVLYVKAACVSQTEPFPVLGQVDLLRKYAKRNGLKVVAEFIDIGGKRGGRKQFQLMLEYLKSRPACKTSVAETTNRLIRSFGDLADVSDLDAEIHFVKEGYQYSNNYPSPIKLALGMRIMMAAHYGNSLGEAIKEGLRRKAARRRLVKEERQPGLAA